MAFFGKKQSDSLFKPVDCKNYRRADINLLHMLSKLTESLLELLHVFRSQKSVTFEPEAYDILLRVARLACCRLKNIHLKQTNKQTNKKYITKAER